MDRSSVISLISYTDQQDTNGVWQKNVRTATDVYCQVDSVTRAEFFAGGQTGLKPEYRFTLFFGDYSGETELEYNGVAYAIYRSYYGRNDTVELYAERKAGVNVAAQNSNSG